MKLRETLGLSGILWVLAGCASFGGGGGGKGEVAPADSISYDTALVASISRISADGVDKDWALVSPDGKNSSTARRMKD
jgi:hypothetical protein